jgi:Zn-dependent protease/CBS domain-containing protein
MVRMNSAVRLGKIRGIEMNLHFSWFIALIAFTFIFARGQYPSLYEDWSEATYWIVALVSVLLLFLSVVIHEFGHAITAQAKNIPVKSITLWIFGGVALLEEESETPGDEFQIAIAGPLASVALSGLFFGLWWLVGDLNEQLGALLGYLALVNLILAVFNMLPGFPLDGGRVVRAILWKATGSLRRATKIVSVIGTLIGTGFFFLGFLSAIEGNLVNGLWYFALGWFLQNAAEQGYRGTEQRELLHGITVAEIIDHDPTTVPVTVAVDELVHDYFLGRNVRGAPVVNNGVLLGIVTLTDVKEIPAAQWPETAVRTIMTPRNQLKTLTPDADIEDALRLMTEHRLNQIPIVAADQPDTLIGMIGRFEFMRYLQTRLELGLTGADQQAAVQTHQPIPTT